MRFDPLRIGLFAELFASVPEEMGSVLERSSFSPNIKERRDYSCAVFDANGRLVAQASHIPVHLGAMEFLMRKWLESGPEIEPDKHYFTNDPYFAGTHLPDITVLRAVDWNGGRIGYLASRAHHSDVGGTSPGSVALVQSIEDEGVRIVPSEMSWDAMQAFAEKTRQPKERRLDLSAQIAAADIGVRRYLTLAQKYGSEFSGLVDQCLAYTELLTRRAIESIPDGEYFGSDRLEDVPHAGGFLEIKLRIQVKGDLITFDFDGTARQAALGINATEAVARSACYYVTRCLTALNFTNGGCWIPVTVIAPPGTIVNAVHPAPVVAGNTETSQRIVDAAFRALRCALPDVIPACSQGTMNNVAMGGSDWAYYETIGGGCGAGPRLDGASGVHCHMSNTRNTPVESLEVDYPIRVLRYELRDGSGGEGLHKGGSGVVREFESLSDGTTTTVVSERRIERPCGAHGGDPGSAGRNVMIRDGIPRDFGGKFVVEMRAGDVLRIETPGGGGWGKKR